MLFFLLLLALTFVSVIVQYFTGSFPNLGGQILVLPVVFLYLAAAMPLPGMLLAAFGAGFTWDCLTNIPVDGESELMFGSSILIFAALGAIMNGLHPLFIRGRWYFHCILVGLLVSLLALIEYVVITFRREPFAFVWPREVWDRVLSSGLVATLISVPLFMVLNWIGRRLGHFQKPRLTE